MNFEAFEDDVMNEILDGNDRTLVALRRQYSNATVVKREFTGVGFFTTFSIVDKSLRLETPKAFHLGNIHAEVSGLNHGIGFLLFVKNGLIDFLEGFTYDEPWPQEINEYQLSII